MPRRGRGATRASARVAASSRRESSQPEPSDVDMQDAPSAASSPRDEATPQDPSDVDDADADGDEDASTPAPDLDVPSRSRSVRKSATPIGPSRRGRAGRPPRTPRAHDGDGSDDGRTASDAGTPKRGRGGFRGGRFGGGRWRNRGGQKRVSQVPLDKEGNMAEVVDDEVVLPEDAEGETKVDRDGHLQGGREYRVRSFTVAGKGDKLYMLSTEPARCIGYRDSYLFFQKHPQLFKVILTDEARQDWIDRHVLPHSYKGRQIGVVTARSVFREFGARIVIGGRKIMDDYRVAAGRANGDVEGELAVPDDILPGPGEEYDRNRYVAWHGASQVYHSNLPTVPLQNGKPEVKKKKVQITDSNWMLEHARAASRFNSELLQARHEAAHGVYDIYTNRLHYPRITQPTHARWEQLPDEPPDRKAIKVESPDGTPAADPAAHGGDADAAAIEDRPFDATAPGRAPFPPLTSFQARNLATVDTHVQFAPPAALGAPGADGGEFDVGPKGLCEVAPDVVAALPAECLGPFLAARDEERRWRAQWGSEAEHGLRADINVTYTAC